MTSEIVLVEDSPTQALQVEILLEDRELSVVTFPSGSQALRYLQTHTPALVISSIVLPDMDGYDLCRRIKTEVGSSAGVILLAGQADSDNEARAKAVFADALLAKSCSTELLYSSIDAVLDSRAKLGL